MPKKKRRRARKSGGLFKRANSRFWWICYSIGGRQRQESTETESKTKAVVILNHRLAQVARREIITTKSPRLSELQRIIERDREIQERKPTTNLAPSFVNLVKHLGDIPIDRLSEENVEQYKATRLKEGAARGTIAVELAWLKRGLRLAKCRLDVTGITVRNARQGFFDEIESVLAAWPKNRNREVEIDMCRYLWLTGWRISEALGLEWRNVERKAQSIRLEDSKTGVRVVPFGTYTELKNLLAKRHDEASKSKRIEPRVFPGVTIQGFRSHFKTAAERAGYPKRTPHDLRRSFIRRAQRAGMSRTNIMSLTGHKTESTFRRYSISDERWVSEDLAKLNVEDAAVRK